jgi:hypothetical protein
MEFHDYITNRGAVGVQYADANFGVLPEHDRNNRLD